MALKMLQISLFDTTKPGGLNSKKTFFKCMKQNYFTIFSNFSFPLKFLIWGYAIFCNPLPLCLHTPSPCWYLIHSLCSIMQSSTRRGRRKNHELNEIVLTVNMDFVQETLYVSNWDNIGFYKHNSQWCKLKY